MRVRCKLCAHEKNGFCQKKTQDTRPVKVRTNKPRSCSLYSEDPLRVLSDYRKKEAHKKNLTALQMRNIQIAEAVQQAQNDLANRKANLKRDEHDD